MRYKLSYRIKSGDKFSTTKAPADDTIVLLNPALGFTFGYLKQFWFRTCRCPASAQSEASTIIQTFPNASFGYSKMRKAKSKRRNSDSKERDFASHLTQAMFVYIRIMEGVQGFDVGDPVPDSDPEYGVLNKDGIHTLFDAAMHDPGFQLLKSKYDVVTDGNCQVCRVAAPAEQKLLKTLAGRPKKVKTQNNTKSKSRCAAVKNVEKIKAYGNKTGGVFVTMDMKKNKKGSCEILHLAEMLNTENTEYKKKCLRIMRKRKIKVGKYAHDCACVVETPFKEASLIDEALLDGFHGKKHKCKTKRCNQKRLNSQAAEQLWSRLDKLGFITHYSRAKFRCLLKHYCIWRNNFVRDEERHRDSLSLMSVRKMMKRKRQ